MGAHSVVKPPAAPMENHFAPGLTTRPAVHVGSQTMPLFRGDPRDQAWDALHVAAAFDRDVAVVRNIDAHYLDYWRSLMGGAAIITVLGGDPGEFLTRVILDDPKTLELIRSRMDPNATLMVFFPTPLEHELAERLDIPLHGSPEISDRFGTKSGIRTLAQDAGIPMPPGFVCSTHGEVQEAIAALGPHFDTVVIKHDLSAGGAWSRRWDPRQVDDLGARLDEVAGGQFVDGRDTVVVEGWLASRASLCAHIEIVAGGEPILCAGWEQLVDADGISHVGAGPLMLSPKAMDSFRSQATKLAVALHQQGAVGSYGPDFLIIDDHETRVEPGTCVLLELNARIPTTAFPLEIVKHIKGQIGAGFCARHVKLPRAASFCEIAEALREQGLLICGRDSEARGVVPYNVGLLPWGQFDVVAMADSAEEALRIVERVERLLV